MRQKGQNLGEYSLGLGLIVVVCIVTVGMIGSNVSQMFTGSITHKSSTKDADSETAGGKGQGVGFITPVLKDGAPFPNLPGKIMEITLENGKKLSINIADPVSVAETDGTLGGTQNALAALQQVISQLETQGEDPRVIEALRKLALKGQDIKDTQLILQNAIGNKTFADNQEYLTFLGNTTLTDVYGNPSSPSKLFQDMNYSNFTNSSIDSLTYMLTAPPPPSTPAGAFLTQLSAVNKLDTVKNSPALQGLLNEVLSLQIYEAMKSTENTMWSQSGVTDLPQNLPIYTQTVRQNSNNICALSHASDCIDRSGVS